MEPKDAPAAPDGAQEDSQQASSSPDVLDGPEGVHSNDPGETTQPQIATPEIDAPQRLPPLSDEEAAFLPYEGLRRDIKAAGVLLYALEGKPKKKKLKVLLVRQNGVLTLPGGKRTAQDATPAHTAAREVEEETHGQLSADMVLSIITQYKHVRVLKRSKYCLFMAHLPQQWKLPKAVDKTLQAGQGHPEAANVTGAEWVPFGALLVGGGLTRGNQASHFVTTTARAVLHDLRACVKPLSPFWICSRACEYPSGDLIPSEIENDKQRLARVANKRGGSKPGSKASSDGGSGSEQETDSGTDSGSKERGGEGGGSISGSAAGEVIVSVSCAADDCEEPLQSDNNSELEAGNDKSSSSSNSVELHGQVSNGGTKVTAAVVAAAAAAAEQQTDERVLSVLESLTLDELHTILDLPPSPSTEKAARERQSGWGAFGGGGGGGAAAAIQEALEEADAKQKQKQQEADPQAVPPPPVGNQDGSAEVVAPAATNTTSGNAAGKQGGEVAVEAGSGGGGAGNIRRPSRPASPRRGNSSSSNAPRVSADSGEGRSGAPHSPRGEARHSAPVSRLQRKKSQWRRETAGEGLGLDGLGGADPGSDTSSDGGHGPTSRGKRVLRHALTQARESSRKSGNKGPNSSGSKPSHRNAFLSLFKRKDAAPGGTAVPGSNRPPGKVA